ncbi:MAG: hypothetical protein ACM3IJ_04990 [Candidatus Levyibacteriota bacterium]
MVRIEILQRFRAKDYLARKKALANEKELQQYLYVWKEQIEAKVWQASHANLFPRFTHAISTTTDGLYYSVSYDRKNDVSIAIIDRDRRKRPGERYAVVVKGASAVFLETVEQDGVKDPYEWKAIGDKEQVRGFLVSNSQSFKSAPLLIPGGEGVWHGYPHNREGILSVVPRELFTENTSE